MPEYDGTAAHGLQAMLDPSKGLAPGDPVRMATAIIATVDQEPTAMRVMLGSQALQTIPQVLRKRTADFQAG